MLLIEGGNIKKYYGDRLILHIENLKIYSEDRIGLVDLMAQIRLHLLIYFVGKRSLTRAGLKDMEARLHRKMGNQKAKANLDRAVKNMKARIDYLEVKEKNGKIQSIKLDALGTGELYSKIVISVNKKIQL